MSCPYSTRGTRQASERIQSEYEIGGEETPTLLEFCKLFPQDPEVNIKGFYN